MIPMGRTEDMEPPDCNSDDEPVQCEQCGGDAADEDTLCAECRRESDEINGNP